MTSFICIARHPLATKIHPQTQTPHIFTNMPRFLFTKTKHMERVG
jgi:hypothetical protein